MQTTLFEVQTCNGNPEIIKVQNGIAREIISEHRTLDRAEVCAKVLNSVDQESELFICLWLVIKNSFYFNHINDRDYIAVCNHLDKLKVKYSVYAPANNRFTLMLSFR